MKAKHTPSPWEHLRQGIEIQSEDGNHEVHAFVNGIPVPVCEVYANMRCEHDDPIGEYMISKQEGIANLLLIAAAPELLEALHLVARYLADLNGCDWIKGGDIGSIDMRQRSIALQRIAIAAIAKATVG